MTVEQIAAELGRIVDDDRRRGQMLKPLVAGGVPNTPAHDPRTLLQSLRDDLADLCFRLGVPTR